MIVVSPILASSCRSVSSTTDAPVIRSSELSAPTTAPMLKRPPTLAAPLLPTQLHQLPPPVVDESITNKKLYWFCAMNNKYISETGADAKLLKSLGFGPNADLHVSVIEPTKINALAEEMRLHKDDEQKMSSMTDGWPRWLRNALKSIFINPHKENAAQEVQLMLNNRLTRILSRKQATDIQNAVGSDIASAATDIPANTVTPSQDLHIELNVEQARALQLVETGNNIYIGGDAGTGKTVLIRAIVRRLEEMNLRVAVTATTGIAGCHIGGSTFHHALGANIANEFVRREELLAYHVVIIDEISMMSQRLFEEFDRCARQETGCSDLPFGGMQLVIVGDFLQLGAVNERSIIHSKLFTDNFTVCKLKTQVRQAENPFFASELSIMRRGATPAELMKRIKTSPPGTLEANAINLLPTNAEVAAANERELAQLPGEPISFSPVAQTPRISRRTSPSVVIQFDPLLPFDKVKLEQSVKEHMQQTFKDAWPLNAYVSCYKQHADAYVLRLVYPDAATEEWCDRATKVLLDLVPTLHQLNCGSRVFEVYQDTNNRHPVELDDVFADLLKKHPIARTTTLKVGCKVLLRSNLTNGLVNGTLGTVTGFAPCHIDSIPRFLQDDRVADLIGKYNSVATFEGLQESALLPVVKFHTGEEVTVPPMEFSVGGFSATEHYSASSIALPLTLAYAFTVHKVQGLTLLGRVHLELSNMWPCPHLLYVAFSRVKNLDQLSISGFKPEMIVADPKAVELDSGLPSVFDAIVPPASTLSLWKAMQLQSLYNTPIEAALRSFGFSGNVDAVVAHHNKKSCAARDSPLRQRVLDDLLMDDEVEASDAKSQMKKTQKSAQERRMLRMVQHASKMCSSASNAAPKRR